MNQLENIEETLLSKAKHRKILRKQKKLQHMLRADCGITSTNVPTTNIAVLNAGIATGLLEEDLLQTCQEHGTISNIIMLPGKSYCFLVLDSIRSAQNIFDHIHGATKLAQGEHPLYLTYTLAVPVLNDGDSEEFPEGLTVLNDFITENEEKLLLSVIKWNPDVIANSMKHRRVQHYGYEFMYTNNNIDLDQPLDEGIPEECDFLWTRLKSCTNFMDDPPNQLTVNQYNPGQGIPSHVDTHSAFLSPILSLSLGSDVVMEFKLGDKKCGVTLPARSMLIMDGAARYEWAHGTVPRTYDLVNGRTKQRQQRTSFTFRWVRPDAKCCCQYPSHCDTYTKENIEKNSNMNDEVASLIEEQHVHEVYKEIATHFSETRSKIWTSVREFVESLEPSTVLVDVGCGNGKNLRLRDDIFQIGVEYNEILGEVAMYYDNMETLTPWNGKMQVVRANCLSLPLNSCLADAAISIAVFHHLATKERRIQAINEMVRILKPKGQTLITVWAKDQMRGEKTSYLKQDRKNRKEDAVPEDKSTSDLVEEIKDSEGRSLNVSLPVHVNRKQFLYQDLLVPWKLKKQNDDSENGTNENTFMRYYHVFEECELEEICKEIKEVKIIKSFYEQGNWCVILEKI